MLRSMWKEVSRRPKDVRAVPSVSRIVKSSVRFRRNSQWAILFSQVVVLLTEDDVTDLSQPPIQKLLMDRYYSRRVLLVFKHCLQDQTSNCSLQETRRLNMGSPSELQTVWSSTSGRAVTEATPIKRVGIWQYFNEFRHQISINTI